MVISWSRFPFWKVLSSGNQIMDDDELLNELDQIEAEELDKKMVDVISYHISVKSRLGNTLECH